MSASEGRKQTDRERLDEALADAYTPEGVEIWWQAWSRANNEKQRRMEQAILADGNCS